MKKIIISTTAVAAVISGFVIGCGSSGGSSSVASDGAIVPQPPVTQVVGTSVACTPTGGVIAAVDADLNASQPMKRNVSSNSLTDENRMMGTSHNTLTSLSTLAPARSANGELLNDGNEYHPLLMSYTQQIVGSYEMGDGSADIGDPTHVDGVFVGFSMDNGDTWKNFTISDTTDKSSMAVTWDGSSIAYPGHAQKPTIAVSGNNILVAWNDKYCPSRNPLDLPQDDTLAFPTDYFATVGNQGSIDYTEYVDGAPVTMIAPNGKEVFEVPFSCVWTARGFFNPADGNITWHTPMQLTSGMRDSNHIKLAGSPVGFAMAWQEDTKGLRSGKGAGPGEGWSGATTNHGTDIWYTSIKMEDFVVAVDPDADTKLASAYNFHYPVRITDNEMCKDGDIKAYCQPMCDTYGTVESETLNNAGLPITRCKSYDTDMLTGEQVVLDGDTGASRAALKIFKTNATEDEYVVVFGYEETKGLSETEPGVPDQDQGTVDTNITAEGKSVYFESFLFDAIDDFNASDPSTIQNVAMPLVSAGNIVNLPEYDPTSGNTVYKNARRLVIGSQVDNCEAETINFAFLYKQAFDTQGSSSDMFVRVNRGFTYDTFGLLNDSNLGVDFNITNVSAQTDKLVATAADYNVTWDPTNLDDMTQENPHENTFSPRIFLRGDDIFVGYAYTPDENKTAQENMPSNFHIHRYIDGAWQGPQNITEVTKADETTVDARFFPTSAGSATEPSDPNVLFLTWGTVEGEGEERSEADIYYRRSIDRGVTWEPEEKLAAREGTVIEEKEVESFAASDGKSFYSVWIQEEEEYNATDPFSGLDSWFGRVDYNVTQ